MKQWAGWAGAAALVVSMSVQAQSGKDLLGKIGRALTGAPEVAAQQARSPYMDPAGTYWDLDEDTLAGAQHLRGGLASTASAGTLTCDAYLIAITRSDYRLSPSQREQCLYYEWLIDTKVHGANGIAARQKEAIELTYGPAFDARAEKFKSIHRFAVRPNIDPQPDYNRERGVLDIYVPIPWVMGFSINGYTGQGFVSNSVRTGTQIGSPPNAGRYHLPLRMSETEAHALFRQGRDAKDDLVVFTVKRVWVEDGSPRAELEVERVELGYANETLGVDLTKQKKGED
ncbi:hypothetical protein [Xanthomonas campestris]|uniref:hypothetical protein n=1 Tax=Xanthomonas campestris TaxID=339 RepID=UPI0020C97827|nr:hypothetical protein [Xanthomonas campestris]MEA9920800.1 hypothetical protein [Xanthomonas campestris pv. raphani]